MLLLPLPSHCFAMISRKKYRSVGNAWYDANGVSLLDRRLLRVERKEEYTYLSSFVRAFRSIVYWVQHSRSA